MIESTQPPLYVPGLPAGTATAMCECGHHWYVHSASRRTGPGAVCWGYHGSATPGPFNPCDCRGFAPWSGPTDARTGEPVKPLTMFADARHPDAADALAALVAANVAAALEAAGPAIRADERASLAAVVSPDLFRKLADWFDADDEFKVAMFPETWSPGSRPDEVRQDLRRFADLLEGGS